MWLSNIDESNYRKWVQMGKTTKFSLRAKLLALICASSLLIGAVFSYVLVASVNQSKKVTKDLISRAEKIEDIGHISYTFKNEVQMWKDLLIRGSNPENFKKYEGEMQARSTEVRQMVEDLKSRMSDPADDALADKFLAAEKDLFDQYQSAKNTHLKPDQFNMAAADGALKGKDRPVTESLKELNDVFEKKMHKTASDSIATLERQMTMGFLTALMASAVIIALSWLVLRRISLRLSQVSRSIAQVSNHIDGAVTEIATASEQLATANTEAAASIEETSASLEEITSMVKRSNESLGATNELATKGNQTAVRGESEMGRLINSMTEIKKSSTKMEEIISVIDDIAFQTNLLALNASVEAARAGEQGKGFAVVAEAVRGLAQRSATSAKDISTLIKDSVSKIEEGAGFASGNEAVLKEIVVAIKKIADLTGDITNMSQEQLSGVEQIAKAISQLDETSQTNAASAEETAGASLQLKEQSRTLQGAMSELQSVIEG